MSSMRLRHGEVLRALEERAADFQEKDADDRRQLFHGISQLNQRMLSRDTEKQLDQMELMYREQGEKIDNLRSEISRTMSQEFEKMRLSTVSDLATIKQSVEQHVSQIDSQGEYEVRLNKVKGDLESSLKTQRLAEDELAELRVRLASAEERARMLQTRQEELRKERGEFDEERKNLRVAQEQQWQKMSGVETELHKLRAETEVQRNELARLSAARSEDAEAVRRERETWRAREAELQHYLNESQRKLEEARRETEVQMLRVETEQREACSQLRMQIGRLEVEAASRVEQLNKARQIQAQLEAERDAAQQREEEIRQQGAFELRQRTDELLAAQARETELMQMLHEVQDSIMIASSVTADGSPDDLM